MNDELQRMEETCVDSRLIFDGKVMHLYHDQIRLPDGNTAYREYARHIGAVCVLPLFADGTVACVRQYRYPHGEILTEIPAGKLEKGEDPIEGAIRELREETGLTAEKLIYFGGTYPSPGFCDEQLHIYLALGLTHGEACPDEDEFLNVEMILLS